MCLLSLIYMTFELLVIHSINKNTFVKCLLYSQNSIETGYKNMTKTTVSVHQQLNLLEKTNVNKMYYKKILESSNIPSEKPLICLSNIVRFPLSLILPVVDCFFIVNQTKLLACIQEPLCVMETYLYIRTIVRTM